MKRYVCNSCKTAFRVFGDGSTQLQKVAVCPVCGEARMYEPDNMKMDLSAELDCICEDEEASAELISTIIRETFGEELYRNRGRELIRAYKANDVDAALVALTGWTMASLVDRMNATTEVSR